MISITQLMTAEDLLRMPDDGFRYELVKGELRKMVAAGPKHGRITVNITTPLDQHVRANNLGTVYAAETGFQITSDPDTVRIPNVAFVHRERVEEAGDIDEYWPEAPDLAVEVISPNDTYTDVEDKVFEWLDAGARMVMVVNPRKRTVTIYRSRTDIRVLTENDQLDGGDVVPGWSMLVREVFA
ncbi:MAG: Uma2 family endonuclease [Nitrospira sp.]|nr:Uma2 family endonuclease [Nitrospira sp.]